MKHLFLTLLLATLCAATSYGQTITSLGYNTTNGQIVAATNVVWTNSFSFSTNTVAAQVRTNLALGATWLTNTNVTNFRTAIGLGTANSVQFDDILAASIGVGVGATSRFTVDESMIEAGLPISFANSGAQAESRTNLGLGGGLITNIVAGTNTLVFSNGILTGVNP